MDLGAVSVAFGGEAALARQREARVDRRAAQVVAHLINRRASHISSQFARLKVAYKLGRTVTDRIRHALVTHLNDPVTATALTSQCIITFLSIEYSAITNTVTVCAS